MDEPESQAEIIQPTNEDAAPARAIPRQRRTAWRVLKFGCLGIFLLMCGLISGITIALQSGPVNMSLPFSNTLKLGSDDFVLSNYSFQDGNTYYLDLNGNGTRNILQIEYIEDTHSLQLTLHHSSKSSNEENQLLRVRLP